MQYFKKNINLFIVIVLFIVLCVSYILIIPVFEAPDENWHFIYAFYMSKYNRISSVYTESIGYEQYIKERTNEGEDPMFFMDEKYILYKMVSGEYREHYSLWHPPTYYFISAQIIKPLGVNCIDAEYDYKNLNKPNLYINNKILKDRSPTNSLVLILRLFQIVYGVLVIFFIYKIIKLLSDDEFKNNSVLLISGIAFLPQFVFLCSYINNDVLSALFGLVSVYFIVLLFKRDKAYLGLISILFAFIGGFTKFTILIMVPVAIIAFLIWLVNKKKKRALISVSVIIFLTIAVLYFVIFSIRKNPPLFIARIISISNEMLAGFRDGKMRFYIDMPRFTDTFKSAVAFFGWMNIVADNFIYYFFLAYVISGILVFFANIRDYRKSKNSIIFIILSIISIFSYFLLHAIYTGWGQNQGRIILLAVFLTYILATLGFKSIKESYKNILYYGLFASSLFISVFCLYNYIYLAYY